MALLRPIRLGATTAILIAVGVVVVAQAASLPAATTPQRPTHLAGDEGMEFFERRIRPVLLEHCHECHSRRSGKTKGGLSLDSADDWLRGGDSGPALVPGDPDSSRLLGAVRYADPELQMPPKQRLPDSTIAALEGWIALGAPGPAAEPDQTAAPGGDRPALAAGARETAAASHWAYRPLTRQTPASVRNTAWPRTAIDRFVLARLEEQGLGPVADADRATLARRIHFDLIGLPPGPREVAAFVADPRPDAIALADLVDRLLASPHYGEHWARHWFDIVRFAESVTLRGFVFPEAWRYRDYVIDSLQADVPMDRFLTEQIAGDLLPAETLEERRRQLVAATFLMLGNTNLEEQDKRQLEMDFIDEQLDVIGKAFLGQTLSCARCHDHKFDPIPTRDYYALAGILKNAVALEHANVSAWVEQPLPLPPERERALADHEAAIAGIQARLQAARKATLPATVEVGSLPGIVIDSAAARPVGDWQPSSHVRPCIGDGYLHDRDEDKGSKTLTFQFEPPRPGRYEVRFAYQAGANRAAQTPVTVFHAEGETLVRVDQRKKPALDGLFVSLGVFAFETNGFAHVLVANEGTRGHVVADAVQFLPLGETPGAMPIPAVAGPNAEAVAVASANEVKELERQLKQLQASGPRRPKAMAPREATNIVDLAVHRRGSVHNLGEVVPRGVLSVVSTLAPPSMPSWESGRRELAAWLTAPGNPLTARVLVNRIWLWTLGRGLVRTPDNFGTTGAPPTHPELLDDLASRFSTPVADGGLGWSTKALVREIVLSRAYGLASHAPPALVAADPDNRLFGRAVRKRLAAEQLRDAMLAVAGTLHLEPPSGPTFPPETRADYGFAARDPWRSVYLPVFRNALPGIFGVFDFPSPDRVVGERTTSTVPPQALFLLNDPWVREQARHAAARLLGGAPDTPDNHPANDAGSPSNDSRLQQAFRLTLGRPPTTAEASALRERLPPADDTPDALEAWCDVVHALFASVDFRYLN